MSQRDDEALPSLQVYLGTEKGANKKGAQQVVFVRGISHEEKTRTPQGADRVLVS
jgi:hypothetical protein